jgi:preprotein translocase subunit SecY
VYLRTKGISSREFVDRMNFSPGIISLEFIVYVFILVIGILILVYLGDLLYDSLIGFGSEIEMPVLFGIGIA